MTELEIMQRAKMYMDKLAMGIDPVSDRRMPADTTLNNPRLSRCFSYVSGVLDQVIANGGEVGQIPRTEPFRITPQQLSGVTLSPEPIRVTQLAQRITDAAGDPRMKKLNATWITNWLVQQGYLETQDLPEGKHRRVPTQKGIGIGLHCQTQMGRTGEYQTVCYTPAAQRFVLEHLQEILAVQGRP